MVTTLSRNPRLQEAEKSWDVFGYMYVKYEGGKEKIWSVLRVLGVHRNILLSQPRWTVKTSAQTLPIRKKPKQNTGTKQ